eukprot:g1974.t1
MGREDNTTLRRSRSFEKIKAFGSSVKRDLKVLKSIWFSKSQGTSHAERLEAFYSPQASAYDGFRKNFLWGREPMLAACAARLRETQNIIWVDLGGGTGENVQMMKKYIPLESFKAIYIVDLCPSLCKEAEKKVIENQWQNVEVVEKDACTFTLPDDQTANLITFSYSLSMIPPFHEAVEQALTYLDADNGLCGVCDFFVSGKYDIPLRQMSWARRFFWRCIFDLDNIDIGPERRNYLDFKLDREWEYNGQGSIPYVPYLRVPWYVWVGRKQSSNLHRVVPRAQAPPLFPPTFLYTMSWEDPDADEAILDINEDDVVLTLTSGGCNSLNYLLEGAKEVYSVDCNPAQSALLEIKTAAIRSLNYEQFWRMFGEGKLDNIESIYEKHLAPFMCQNSIDFWNKKLYHFRRGLYYAGGMGKVCWIAQYLIYLSGSSEHVKAICEAESLEEQRALWDELWIIKFLLKGNQMLINLLTRLSSVFLFNRITLWFGAGVPSKQYKLILKDGYSIPVYFARTIDGVARYSHIKKQNYFYYNCLNGKYLPDNCPAYLKEPNFWRLKTGLLDRLHVQNGKFNDELRTRQYSKVILMDHIDWMDDKTALEVIELLARQVMHNGRMIFRSASLCPPYVQMMKDNGFKVTCVKRADQGGYYMDKVNMYHSFYMALKL